MEKMSEKTWEELEEMRQRDVESGAMAYGETAASKEMRRREEAQDSSIKTVKSDQAPAIDISLFTETNMVPTYEKCVRCGTDEELEYGPHTAYTPQDAKKPECSHDDYLCYDCYHELKNQ